jgi:mono/diheme cytochrome c family protein
MSLVKMIVIAIIVCTIGAAAFVVLAWRPSIAPVASNAQTFNDELVARGKNLAALGNCITCHTSRRDQPFAGGLALRTPFGTIYSTNITPDPETGIGRWPEIAFRRAMREGVDRQGRHLYPAFPYDHFTLLTDQDNQALYAYLMTRTPVRTSPHENELPFPLNIRLLIAGWKLLFFSPGRFQPNSTKSASWNHGAYLVEGLAHCGACHTPRNALGAERRSDAFAGGEAEGWTAYALNGSSPAPVPWNSESLSFYLRNGWHAAHGGARGPMAPVVENLASSQRSDIEAIAAYMAGILGEPSAERRQKGEALIQRVRDTRAESNLVFSENQTVGRGDGATRRGALVYAAACATCHESIRPAPFGGINLALSTGPSGPTARNVINVVLWGVPPAEGRRSPIMPGFANVLTDEQLVALLAYLRSRFGDKPPWQNLEQDVHDTRSGKRHVSIYSSPVSDLNLAGVGAGELR